MTQLTTFWDKLILQLHGTEEETAQLHGTKEAILQQTGTNKGCKWLEDKNKETVYMPGTEEVKIVCVLYMSQIHAPSPHGQTPKRDA